MEPVTSIIGLLPLVEIACRTTSKLCRTISEVKGLPQSLAKELDWLRHLREVLLRFEFTCQQVQYLIMGVNIDLLEDRVNSCSSLVQDLEKQIDERLGKIRGKSFRSRIEALSAVFNSEAFQRSKSEIDHCTKDLSLAHQEVSRYKVDKHNQVSLLK